ncbi:hypothetical protein [Sphingosinicella rhizophila]|uniref:Uncharacterized protein n=1 Tax=Sphingosinicella rhizophila TaxID=3050082 RepID=A0ABU3Q4Z2_9SPHN|nr:hypothetical protein [Sphingosinicella sp. GR2756]MDT9598033.1 hypothetical protein [Sphingosinicella sp. GR2756]
MQRVRIGLTGLAFVFVFVLLAAIFTRPSEEEAITANTIEQKRVDSGGNEAQPTEPLAELGVVPGNADNVSATDPASAER